MKPGINTTREPPAVAASASRERVVAALVHRHPDRIPIDFGATFVTGMHVTCVAALREYYGLERRAVRVIDPGQMLGEIDDELKAAMGIDTHGVFPRVTRFGFPADQWKIWRMWDSLEVLVPRRFNTTTDENGDLLMHPQGDLLAPPSARMPRDGYFFDNIIRQDPIDEQRLDPADNLEEFTPLSDQDLDHFEKQVERAADTGRAVIATFGRMSLGDVNAVPAPGLKHPKGIRDIAEWYVSTKIRRDYIHRVFDGESEMAVANLARIAARVHDRIDVAVICGTDFGTQRSTFCSATTFNELWAPYYRRINDWIHRHTRWKTFKHSCGAVEPLLTALADCGFDIINPVQCSAAGMDPERLKRQYGERLVFWGGGAETQTVLAFGTPHDVREQVLRRCDIFSRSGGFVFASVHNIQAKTPVENTVAAIEAVQEFNGAR
jgi:hypothetical protein